MRSIATIAPTTRNAQAVCEKYEAPVTRKKLVPASIMDASAAVAPSPVTRLASQKVSTNIPADSSGFSDHGGSPTWMAPATMSGKPGGNTLNSRPPRSRT